jgi:hypothetical protein
MKRADAPNIQWNLDFDNSLFFIIISINKIVIQ